LKNCSSTVVLLIVLIAATATASAAELVGVDPLSGQQQTLDLDQPLTHLIFFAAWCPPCLEEIPELTDLEARWEPEGYRQIWIAIKERQPRSRVERFLSGTELRGSILYDSDGSLQKRFQIGSVPRHVLMDQDGRQILSAGSLGEGVVELVEQKLANR
jgi:thiol-disulfide isomerase/thioredoxin